jgi:hypothetical protein
MPGLRKLRMWAGPHPQLPIEAPQSPGSHHCSALRIPGVSDPTILLVLRRPEVAEGKACHENEKPCAKHQANRFCQSAV